MKNKFHNKQIILKKSISTPTHQPPADVPVPITSKGPYTQHITVQMSLIKGKNTTWEGSQI